MSDTSDADASSEAHALPLDAKQLRKAEKKRVKELKRAKRQGLDGGSTKECTLCYAQKKLLIRCRIDETMQWHMVCGKCWHDVAGGVTDGDADHPHYRYGGLWKARDNRS
jgi:hypothetical protein